MTRSVPSPPLLVVERASLRAAQDFSRDTPQPKLVSRRGCAARLPWLIPLGHLLDPPACPPRYLHRRAKEGSPFSGGGTTSPIAGSTPLSPRAGTSPLPDFASVAGGGSSRAFDRLGTAVKSLQFD
jgi:hypothetical protein